MTRATKVSGGGTTMTMLAEDFFATQYALEEAEKFARRWANSPSPEAAREAWRVLKIIEQAMGGEKP